MNQVIVLSVSTAVLAFLSFFHVYSEGADISALNDDLAQPTVIYDANGEVASKISALKNEGIKIEEVPDHVKNAVIAIEDHRFYEHDGVDLVGISRAFVQNVKAGGIVEGGSTITQQLTKNALLSSEKTYKRKLEEFFLAREIEKQYSKDEIMQMYLNRIYFGNGTWGVKRAAMGYFGKDVKDLTISESALLAGLIKAPSSLDPYKNYDKAMERRDVVLLMMKTHGFIKEEEYKAAQSEKIALNENGGDPLRGRYPYYVDHVIDEAIKKFGFTQEEILTGGLQIYTELDVTMQSAVEATYAKEEIFPKGTEKQIVQSGAVLVDPKTGGIRALVGGRGEHVFRGYNRATHLKAQPGSTMKPLAVFAPAIEEGWAVTDMLKDEELELKDYKPENFNGKYKGEVPMYEALKDSLNVPAVWLLNEIGIVKGMESVKNFGIDLDPINDRNLGLALGGLSTGVSPVTMAEAYSAFANNGERHETHAITKIVDKEGNTIAEHKGEKSQVISKETAEKMTTMLLNVVQDGTGKGAQIEGRELAGKTGSTQVPIDGIKGTKDQWFVGYTPQLVGAVWVGYDKTDKEHYLTTTSSEGAALIFKDFMSEALKNTKAESFNVPPISKYVEEHKRTQRAKSVKELEKRVKKEAEKLKKQWEQAKQKSKDKKEEKPKDEAKDNKKKEESTAEAAPAESKKKDSGDSDKKKDTDDTDKKKDTGGTDGDSGGSNGDSGGSGDTGGTGDSGGGEGDGDGDSGAGDSGSSDGGSGGGTTGDDEGSDKDGN
ncbi:transglycosylase domain-containing protein [Mesobacillus subterraneus]|uniref:Penicillin-binding protein 1A n=1 Tax=Mesobacillus subterraneus TaxID=285983 RepID=A0A427TXP4_9BACI|nr:penicillin-binding protein 1A [Mesobacillus subterraneus]RSD29243.1 penicillin-binding protein 1A [Mesobacillus subterraneus]